MSTPAFAIYEATFIFNKFVKKTHISIKYAVYSTEKGTKLNKYFDDRIYKDNVKYDRFTRETIETSQATT